MLLADIVDIGVSDHILSAKFIKIWVLNRALSPNIVKKKVLGCAFIAKIVNSHRKKTAGDQ